MTAPGAAVRTPLSAHGISIGLPADFEGRISLRGRPGRPGTVRSVTGRGAAAAVTEPVAPEPLAPGERHYPVSHVANFPLPPDRGDFGCGAVDRMTGSHCLIALVEYGPECVGTALFAPAGMPTPAVSAFGPDTLQHRISGQLGYQRFFTVSGRPFCLYVVLGGARNAAALVGRVRSVLAATTVAAA
ncbi:hypothetical protein [Nakamurella endophytica]|uniref:Uncharacterized protein n=1 Tax=Nakamurella endophytica TaxID=1748367 RepID=A0A917WND2_9ACTN|nr:hypothetical protein [Nakamurella endophytica]GGM18414.1 hypothetical protein GCM10011594_43120 [Nakamurella endophytica]